MPSGERRHVQEHHVRAPRPRARPPGSSRPAPRPRQDFCEVSGSLPKISATSARTSGIRVAPPTRITASNSPGASFASAKARRQWAAAFFRRWAEAMASNAWRRAPKCTRLATFHICKLLCGEPYLQFARLGERSSVKMAKIERSRESYINIVPAQARVAVRRKHPKQPGIEFKNGDVKRPAAQVVHGDLRAVAQPVQSVGERGGGGLVDDALHLQTGQLPGSFRRLTLRVVEVRGHGDDCPRHRHAQRPLGIRPELAQHQRGDFPPATSRARRSAPAPGPPVAPPTV